MQHLAHQFSDLVVVFNEQHATGFSGVLSFDVEVHQVVLVGRWLLLGSREIQVYGGALPDLAVDLHGASD
jgi:hypothetical protein